MKLSWAQVGITELPLQPFKKWSALTLNIDSFCFKTLAGPEASKMKLSWAQVGITESWPLQPFKKWSVLTLNIESFCFKTLAGQEASKMKLSWAQVGITELPLQPFKKWSVSTLNIDSFCFKTLVRTGGLQDEAILGPSWHHRTASATLQKVVSFDPQHRLILLWNAGRTGALQDEAILGPSWHHRTASATLQKVVSFEAIDSFCFGTLAGPEASKMKLSWAQVGITELPLQPFKKWSVSTLNIDFILLWNAGRTGALQDEAILGPSWHHRTASATLQKVVSFDPQHRLILF